MIDVCLICTWTLLVAITSFGLGAIAMRDYLTERARRQHLKERRGQAI